MPFLSQGLAPCHHLETEYRRLTSTIDISAFAASIWPRFGMNIPEEVRYTPCELILQANHLQSSKGDPQACAIEGIKWALSR